MPSASCPILVHPYSRDPTYALRQRDTWDMLASVEPELRERGWSTVHLACGTDNVYEETLRGLWSVPRDIIILEHDMVPTMHMLHALAECREPLCAQAYRLHFLSDVKVALQWVADKRSAMDAESLALLERFPLDGMLNQERERDRDRNGRCWEPFCHRSFLSAESKATRWGRLDDEWADLVGFGLTKIGWDWRRQHPAGWRRGRWGDLDGRVCTWVRRQSPRTRWHVHGPECKHNHPCAQAAWVGEVAGVAGVSQGPRAERLARLAACPEAAQVPWELEEAMAACEELRPQVVLEVGVQHGGTLARWAMCAAEDALIVGVDAHPPSEAAIPRGPRQTVALVEGDSHSAATMDAVRDVLHGRPVDWLFIDGDHSWEGVSADYRAFAPLVRPGGIVAFHDICAHPSSASCHVDRLWNRLAVRHPDRAREIIWSRDQNWAGIGLLHVPEGDPGSA